MCVRAREERWTVASGRLCLGRSRESGSGVVEAGCSLRAFPHGGGGCSTVCVTGNRADVGGCGMDCGVELRWLV